MPSCEFKLRLRGSICERGQKKLQSRDEDKRKIRARHEAENFSLLKRCVLNLVKADISEKDSVSGV